MAAKCVVRVWTARVTIVKREVKFSKFHPQKMYKSFQKYGHLEAGGIFIFIKVFVWVDLKSGVDADENLIIYLYRPKKVFSGYSGWHYISYFLVPTSQCFNLNVMLPY